MIELLSGLPLIIKAVVVAGALSAGLISHYVLLLPKNNNFEQAAEKLIKDETGIDVDFSSMPSAEHIFDSLDDDDDKV
jgi:hypothetical protein